MKSKLFHKAFSPLSIPESGIAKRKKKKKKKEEKRQTMQFLSVIPGFVSYKIFHCAEAGWFQTYRSHVRKERPAESRGTKFIPFLVQKRHYFRFFICIVAVLLSQPDHRVTVPAAARSTWCTPACPPGRGGVGHAISKPQVIFSNCQCSTVLERVHCSSLVAPSRSAPAQEERSAHLLLTLTSLHAA